VSRYYYIAVRCGGTPDLYQAAVYKSENGSFPNVVWLLDHVLKETGRAGVIIYSQEVTETDYVMWLDRNG